MEKSIYIEDNKKYEFITSNSMSCKQCVFFNNNIIDINCDKRPCMKHLRTDNKDGYFIKFINE